MLRGRLCYDVSMKTSRHFRLSDAALGILSRRSKELGISETAWLEIQIRASDGSSRMMDGFKGMTEAETADQSSFNDPARETRQAERRERKAKLIEEVASALPERRVKLCEHGSQPSLCKYSKCRKT